MSESTIWRQRRRWLNGECIDLDLNSGLSIFKAEVFIELLSMSVKLTIISQIEQIAGEQNKKLAPLTDDLVLLESGLDSLAFAILVARLEDVLGVDPFTASDDVYYPVTLGEFIKFYENVSR
jgi:acyl carrier protein